MPKIKAEPYPYEFDTAHAALVIIDMQRDFLEPGGFGDALGNEVWRLAEVIGPARGLLKSAREAGMLVIHTREGHRPDLTDLPPAKHRRGLHPLKIGDVGPMGRILVHGEPGHGIVPELAPIAGEPVIDKPGKGAFFATDLETILRNQGVTHLFIAGVTTEVCVNTTAREANDRGYEVMVVSDCTGSYFPEFHQQALRMIAAQGGVVGWVGESQSIIQALQTDTPATPADTGELAS